MILQGFAARIRNPNLNKDFSWATGSGWMSAARLYWTRWPSQPLNQPLDYSTYLARDKNLDKAVAKPLTGSLTLKVPASTKAWTSSGVLIECGKTYSISAQGQWSVGKS